MDEYIKNMIYNRYKGYVISYICNKGTTKQRAIKNIKTGLKKGELGYLIAIEHTGSFIIAGKSETVYSETYQYSTELVTKIYSVYIHVTPRPRLGEGQLVRVGEQIAILAGITHPHLHFPNFLDARVSVTADARPLV